MAATSNSEYEPLCYIQALNNVLKNTTKEIGGGGVSCSKMSYVKPHHFNGLRKRR